MSSQASSAGGGEAKVRQALVESGDVDIMIAIRSNFFYTRTVPCELWFLNRAKPEAYRDKVLMLDARNLYRKVTRRIYDFSLEQEQNLLAVVWLYRGETERLEAARGPLAGQAALAGRRARRHPGFSLERGHRAARRAVRPGRRSGLHRCHLPARLPGLSDAALAVLLTRPGNRSGTARPHADGTRLVPRGSGFSRADNAGAVK